MLTVCFNFNNVACFYYLKQKSVQDAEIRYYYYKVHYNNDYVLLPKQGIQHSDEKEIICHWANEWGVTIFVSQWILLSNVTSKSYQICYNCHILNCFQYMCGENEFSCLGKLLKIFGFCASGSDTFKLVILRQRMLCPSKRLSIRYYCYSCQSKFSCYKAKLNTVKKRENIGSSCVLIITGKENQ